MTITTAASAEPAVSVRTPDDLLNAIPLLIGFEPENSLVVIGFRPPQVEVTVRYDLDPDGCHAADVAEHAVGVISGQAIPFLAAVGYGPASAVDPLIDAIACAADEAGIAVPRALRVQDGRFFSYTGDGPAEGIPFTTARYEGVLARREDLAAQLASAADTEAMARAIAQAAPAGPARQSMLTAVAGMIGRYRDGGRLAGEDEAARLLVALRHLRVRDDAWARMDAEHRAGHRRLWTDLTRMAPAGYAAAPASLLAFVAWQCGDGALANVALDRALEDSPDYSMGQLLRQVITSGAPPSMARLPMTPEEVAASYDEAEGAILA